jgi:DNA modification methylase
MEKRLLGELELNRIYQRDCLEGMRMIPDSCIDLVIADPPYYRIKGDFDFKWRTMSEYIEWCADWLKECERVLSPKGSLYLYGVELQLEHIAVKIAENTSFEYRNRITLNKKQSYIKDLYGSQEKFRRFIPSSEFLLFYTFKDETGLERMLVKENFLSVSEIIRSHVENNFSREYVTRLFLKEGRYSTEQSAKVHASYKMGWNKGKRFDLMDKKLFEYLNTHLKFPFTYEELKHKYTELRRQHEDLRQEYEHQRYTFNAKDGMSNVWEFEPDRGKLKTTHPTQKPLAICERIIEVSSNHDDIVLIPFVGSGSECVAAVRTGRNFIGFEREPEYVEIANKRLDNEISKEVE